MKELGNAMDFKAKTITIDDITLPVIASTICKNASTLRLQKLNNSSAKEPISTQYTNKCATWMLDTIKNRSPVNCQRQMQASQCRSSKKLLQKLINELPFDSTLDAWKTKPVSFQQRKRIPYHNRAFPVLKTHIIPSSS
jgi:hypothetical protein